VTQDELEQSYDPSFLFTLPGHHRRGSRCQRPDCDIFLKACRRPKDGDWMAISWSRLTSRYLYLVIGACGNHRQIGQGPGTV